MFAIIIVLHLEKLALRIMPEGSNKPTLAQQLVLNLVSLNPLAQRLKNLYREQVRLLASLPLTKAVQRRQAFMVRSSLRIGVGCVRSKFDWIKFLFDVPVEEAQKLLQLESANIDFQC